MPGVGKTNVAIEYVYRHRKEYEYVFWITADSEENIQSGYDAIARHLKLVSAAEQDQSLGVHAALHWLSEKDNYLLVLDNADEINTYEHLVPQTGAHILLTARPNSVKVVATAVPVLKMEDPEGAECLLAWAGIRNPTPKQHTEAKHTSVDLGGLPLALRQAGAYIAASEDDIARYRVLLADHRSELLKKTTGLTKDAHTVYGTFTLALNKLEAKHPAASELLRFCAFLAPDAIPEYLFTEHPEALTAPLSDVAASALEWNETLQAAASLALIERNTATKTFSVHRLVQDVIRAARNDAANKDAVKQVAHILYCSHPGSDIDGWRVCEQLLEHQRVCLSDIEDLHISTEDSAAMCNQAGFYLYERGAYSSAILFLIRALEIRESVLGPNHRDTATSLNNLAHLYQSQGDYVKAEPLHVRALEIRESVLGPNHRDTASSLNNLAGLYDSQGDYVKAEPLHVRALGIRESVLGPNHRDTATSLNNLAGLYDSQGDYVKAEPLYVRALGICESVLGPNHRDTASSLNNLAVFYYHQQKIDDAEKLLRRVAAIREDILGMAHPDTASAFENWAVVLHVLNRPGEAAEKYAKAEAIREAHRRNNVPRQ